MSVGKLRSVLIQFQQIKQFSRLTKDLQPVIAINDLKKDTRAKYSKNEEILRCKLASFYRLVYLHEWTYNIYNHITARVDDGKDKNHFLINPFGLFYSEITASSLVKIDENCSLIDQGSTKFGVNNAGFTIHSAIHVARPDINFIAHVHTGQAAAVSATKYGLLPISQEAMICGEISYHNYGGIFIDEDMKKKIAKDLGPVNKIMILRNHGVVVCGETIEETWHYLYNLMYACEIQCKAIAASSGGTQLIIPDKTIGEKVKKVTGQGGGGVNVAKKSIDWKLGELEFEAYMRCMDSMGFDTGYPYRHK